MRKNIMLLVSGRDMQRVLRTGGIDDLSRNLCEAIEKFLPTDEELIELAAEWKAMSPIFERLRLFLSNAIHGLNIDVAALGNAKHRVILKDFHLSDEEIAHLRKNTIEPRVMCEMAYEWLADTLWTEPYYENLGRAFDDLAKWLSRVYQLMLTEMLGEDEVLALDFKC